MSRRHASYQCFFQYWHLSRKQNYIDALNSKSKHLYKTICWLLVINISEFSDFICCFFLKTGALKPLKHKLKPDKSKKKKKKAVFSAPAQTSNRPTWLRPSVWVPPLGTVVPGTHASRGPEGHDRSTHTQNNINDPNTQTKKKKLFLVVLVPVWWTNVFYSRSSDLLTSFWSVFCTWDVRFSLSRILSLTSRTRDAML